MKVTTLRFKAFCPAAAATKHAAGKFLFVLALLVLVLPLLGAPRCMPLGPVAVEAPAMVHALTSFPVCDARVPRILSLWRTPWWIVGVKGARLLLGWRSTGLGRALCRALAAAFSPLPSGIASPLPRGGGPGPTLCLCLQSLSLSLSSSRGRSLLLSLTKGHSWRIFHVNVRHVQQVLYLVDRRREAIRVSPVDELLLVGIQLLA
ncbi:hypothetical protein DUNSADRAFT_14812 [Dunaliella salina]|uniref:Encoded protein n=1 Tax=Dunaliella salina TaxID=3046 RepID=A0ABQ7G6N0_DUNSA|nr:hypothetical protein DUNSADRAFT_14812 [Dunaliella salina]|eukprot:KAF5830255.1 hypothetical protein DUNSADRAFT_14812 [Dunaliella salina]